jgi:hypothetical protein
MTLAHLESLKSALLADAGVCALVDCKVYKFLAIEKSEPDLRMAAHRSLISCEIGEWAGGKTSTDPVFVVDIRSRYGSDGGAEHCSQIASSVKELLAGGFGEGAVLVSDIRGEVKFDKSLVAYRCRLEIFCRLKAACPLSLTTSLPSPQPPGLEVELICAAPDSEESELLYRFLHQPPGASYWKDLSGWQSRNWTAWRPTLAESGTNVLKVLVMDAKHAGKGGCDAEASISFTVAP